MRSLPNLLRSSGILLCGFVFGVPGIEGMRAIELLGFDPWEKGRELLASLLLASLLGLVSGGSSPCLSQSKEAAPAQDKPAVQHAQPRGKKLFLTDGSFHVVRTYERQGDRVRYYSVERSAWEEIPVSLVDWEATRKAEEEASKLEAALAEKKREAESASIAEEVDVDASIEIGPGLFLPDGVGLFVLEGRILRPLAPVGAEVKLDKGRLITQILLPIPIMPSRHRVQLPGARADFRISTAQPEFYMRTEDAREPDLELIRAKVRGKTREIEQINTIALTGDKFEKRNAVSIERWQLARGVYRLTISQSLEPGEYVLAEITPGEGMNLGVWDFGVDVPAPPQPSPKKK